LNLAVALAAADHKKIRNNKHVTDVDYDNVVGLLISCRRSS
jgi:hypothetical protein